MVLKVNQFKPNVLEKPLNLCESKLFQSFELDGPSIRSEDLPRLPSLTSTTLFREFSKGDVNYQQPLGKSKKHNHNTNSLNDYSNKKKISFFENPSKEPTQRNNNHSDSPSSQETTTCTAISDIELPKEPLDFERLLEENLKNYDGVTDESNEHLVNNQCNSSDGLVKRTNFKTPHPFLKKGTRNPRTKLPLTNNVTRYHYYADTINLNENGATNNPSNFGKTCVSNKQTKDSSVASNSRIKKRNTSSFNSSDAQKKNTQPLAMSKSFFERKRIITPPQRKIGSCKVSQNEELQRTSLCEDANYKLMPSSAAILLDETEMFQDRLPNQGFCNMSRFKLKKQRMKNQLPVKSGAKSSSVILEEEFDSSSNGGDHADNSVNREDDTKTFNNNSFRSNNTNEDSLADGCYYTNENLGAFLESSNLFQTFYYSNSDVSQQGNKAETESYQSKIPNETRLERFGKNKEKKNQQETLSPCVVHDKTKEFVMPSVNKLTKPNEKDETQKDENEGNNEKREEEKESSADFEENELLYDEAKLEQDCKEIERQLTETLYNNTEYPCVNNNGSLSLPADDAKRRSIPKSCLLGGPRASYGAMKRKELGHRQVSSKLEQKSITGDYSQKKNYTLNKNIGMLPFSSNTQPESRDSIELQLFAAQAQAKIATVTQQIERLRQLEKELEAKSADLEYEKAQFETMRDQQRLKFIAERETLMMEIEEEKKQIRRRQSCINSCDPHPNELIRQRDELEDDNRKLRVKLAQLREEFSAKEERYQKLVQRLGNQVYSLEKKNKSLLESVHDLEQASFQLNTRLTQQLDRVSELTKKKQLVNNKSLSIRSKPVNIGNQKEKQQNIDHKPIREKLGSNKFTDDDTTPRSLIVRSVPNLSECRRKPKVQRPHSEDNVAKRRVMDDSSSDISYVSSQQTVPFTELGPNNEVTGVETAAYMGFQSIEKNRLPESEFKDILEFVLQSAWKPFDESIYSLSSTEALKQLQPPTTTPDGRQEIIYCDGHKHILFIDGMRKIICPNGWIFHFLTNGDIRGTNSFNFTYYYYHKDTIYSITTPDGRVYTTFPDGQVDCKFPNGKTQVRFPQGILKQIDEDGVEHIQYVSQFD